jgi:hypothetical protein
MFVVFWAYVLEFQGVLSLEGRKELASTYIEGLLGLLKGGQGPGGRFTLALYTCHHPRFIAPMQIPYF